MKQGEAVFLPTSPECRGNISLVGDDWIDVTWHPFVKDKPETLAMGLIGGKGRTRVRYELHNGSYGNIGFGDPS